MSSPEKPTEPEQPEQAASDALVKDLIDISEVAAAIDTENFDEVLDLVPVAILITKVLDEQHRIIYVNKAFEKTLGHALADLKGRGLTMLDALKREDDSAVTVTLNAALQNDEYFLGTFQLSEPKPLLLEAYANVIENEEIAESYRILALIDVTERTREQREEFLHRLREKDALLLELAHRVKNNLQLVTAMIRLESRYHRSNEPINFDKLAGRIEALQLLYRDLAPDAWGAALDLGHYVSQIASGVVHVYGVDGIRLDLKVDHALASINIAMPVGLIVNELLTNAFKYAFKGRETGTITVRCLHEAETSYRVVVADDGVGLPPGINWPVPGKLSAIIVQTLRENAQKVQVSVETASQRGTRITIDFEHKASPPRLQ
jgi:PAS domain S-box-containing protein